MALFASSCAIVAGERPSAGFLLLLTAVYAAGLATGWAFAWRESRETILEAQRAPLARIRMHVKQLLEWARSEPQLELRNASVWERLHDTDLQLRDMLPSRRGLSWELGQVETVRSDRRRYP